MTQFHFDSKGFKRNKCKWNFHYVAVLMMLQILETVDITKTKTLISREDNIFSSNKKNH